MFGIENWDGDFEGLMALFTTLMFIGLVMKFGWETRNDGTWNDVFKMYGFVMASFLVFVALLMIHPLVGLGVLAFLIIKS